MLQWGRVPGNNPILRFYGEFFQDCSDACRALFAKFKYVLPKGNNRVKVRMFGKDQLKAKEKEIGSTLGDETTGMVVVDYEGHPIRFNMLEVYKSIVAKHKSVRFDVQAVGDGLTWRKASSSLEIDEGTFDDHCETISSGTHALIQDAFVKACSLSHIYLSS